ncbi:glycosyltransferase family 39 protein [Patescibacteria group bacterium]|nr:glycosyltransferase family 39 protein [Patescibacteria group bacterium]
MAFLILLAVSLFTRLWYIAQPIEPWWDTSVYVGMGKFMFTDGAIGIWESLRPVLWPFVLGIFWKIGLDPQYWGKIIQILCSLGALYILYKIGERIYKYVGIVSATIFSFTPVVFYYTAMPITDIPSMFFSLLGAYNVLNKRTFLAGLSVGIAFALRFPHALFVVPFGIFLLITLKKQSIKPLINLAVGFWSIALPYFLINIHLYQDALLPLRLGQTVVNMITSQFQGPLYYAITLFTQNPLTIFALVGLGFYITAIKTWRSQEALTLIVLSILFVGGYFNYLEHKELRYSLAFLPYITLLIGYGLIRVSSYIPKPGKTIGIYILIIVLAGGVYIFKYIPTYIFYLSSAPSEARMRYYTFPLEDANIITTSPQFVAYNNVKVVDFFDTWDNAYRVFSTYEGEFDHVALELCKLQCTEETCENSKQKILAELTARYIQIFSEQDATCHLVIYKRI